MHGSPQSARRRARRQRCGQGVQPQAAGQKTDPRKPAGGRSTDPTDYPVDRVEYALRDVAGLTAKANAAGPASASTPPGCSMSRLPWTSMRTVYRLLGRVRSYGPQAVEAACARALELDVVDVTQIARMFEQAREHEPRVQPAKVVGGPTRVARDTAKFSSAFTAGHRR